MSILGQRIENACYQYIMPHLDRLKAEPDVEKCLPMMEPAIFSRFASQAASDVGHVIIGALGEQYRSLTMYFDSVPAHLWEFAISDSQSGSCRRWLCEGIQDFQGDLSQYASEYQRFRQVVGQSRQVAWNAGINAAKVAFSMFEGITAVMGTVAGSLVAGNRIDQQVRAEYERFCHAQEAMLDAYDQAMTKLLRMGEALLFQHYQRLTAAIQSCN